MGYLEVLRSQRLDAFHSCAHHQPNGPVSISSWSSHITSPYAHIPSETTGSFIHAQDLVSEASL